jgi:hypothetical protein
MCRVCFLAAHPEPDCVRYGAAVDGPNRQRLGLHHQGDWHYCSAVGRPHTQAVPDPASGSFAVCKQRGCGPRCPSFSSSEWRWIATADLMAETVRFIAKLPDDITSVGGISRSGLLPATIIATHLHLPLFEVNGRLARLGAGSRGGSLVARAGRMLIVDDTIYTGSAMDQARAIARAHRTDAVFAAIYARPEAAHKADLIAAELPSPHFLEWNFFNNGPLIGYATNKRVYREGVATDFDGILCADGATSIGEARPYLLPRAHPVKLIVTGRPESTRAASEAWLAKWGAKFERMAMMPGHALAEAGEIAAFKAREFAASPLGIFVESDPWQAERIFRLSGKPTICPAAKKVWH